MNQASDPVADMAHLPSWPRGSDWTGPLQEALQAPSLVELQDVLRQCRASREVYPADEDVFAAFRTTPLARTKVVILGQDPYHGPGQAMGLSFSVPQGVAVPPSLRNIFRELVDDLGVARPTQGDLTPWARQGVLLLNTVLTVERGQAHSHRKMGWESFTDSVLQLLGKREQPTVFMLWGKPAQQKQKWIEAQHPVIASPHPSPLSAHRGFLGSRPFSQANDYLGQLGHSPIDWALP